MARLFRSLATWLGAAVLVSAAATVLIVGLRLLQVRVFRTPAELVYLENKEAYLAENERLFQSRLVSEVRPKASATGPAAQHNQAGRPPNFIVILFDDLGYGDLSSYGNRLIETPRIDTLAASGLRMTDFYSTAPVCTPSRAALLTGRYPFRSGTDPLVFFPDDSLLGTIRLFFGLPNEVARDEIFLPEALRSAGYATGMIGKWHLGEAEGHRPIDLGFDHWYGVYWSNDMQPLHVYRGDQIELRNETEMDALHSFRDEEDPRPHRGVDQSEITERYTHEAIAFIEQSQAAGPKPFFLYLAHTAPHVPHFPNARFAGQSRGGVYGDVVEDLDRSTGQIVDALGRLGLSENTLVLVTSDNGADYSGSVGGLRGRKTENYEGGQRVPMIAAWPGHIAPATSGELGMQTDLLPTLLSLAGVPLPSDRVIDGRDLSETWLNGAPSPHLMLFYFGIDPTAPPTVAAVRDAQFKYRLRSGDRGRSHPHLSSLAEDEEAHDLRRLFPEAEARLAAAAEGLQAAIDADRRGIARR